MTPTILPKATLSYGSSLSLRSLSLMPASCSHPGHHPGLRCSPVSAAVKQMLKPTPPVVPAPRERFCLASKPVTFWLPAVLPTAGLTALTQGATRRDNCLSVLELGIFPSPPDYLPAGPCLLPSLEECKDRGRWPSVPVAPVTPMRAHRET